MVHAVSYGLYLGVGLLAAWIWQWRFHRLGRLALLLPVPVMLAGVYGSYTRSVWMGVGLGLLLVLALTLHGAWRWLVVGGAISAAVLVAATKMDALVSFDRELPASYTGKSVELRGEIAYVSWKMFLDRPILGFGFDQFPQAKLPYLSDRSTALNLEATRTYVHHNTFLSLLTETGLVGLGLMLAILALWGRMGWRLACRADLPDWARPGSVDGRGTGPVRLPGGVPRTQLPLDGQRLAVLPRRHHDRTLWAIAWPTGERKQPLRRGIAASRFRNVAGLRQLMCRCFCLLAAIGLRGARPFSSPGVYAWGDLRRKRFSDS